MSTTEIAFNSTLAAYYIFPFIFLYFWLIYDNFEGRDHALHIFKSIEPSRMGGT